MGSYIFLENSQPRLRVVPSPQEVTTAAIATAAPTALRSFILFIANIFSFIVLHFNRARRLQQAFNLFVVGIVLGIDGDNKPIICRPQVHHTRRPPRKQVVTEEKRSDHAQRTKKNRYLKSDRYKRGQRKRGLTTDIHRPVISHRVVQKTESKACAGNPETKRSDR